MSNRDEIRAAGDEGELGIESMGSDRFRRIICSRNGKWMRNHAKGICFTGLFEAEHWGSMSHCHLDLIPTIDEHSRRLKDIV
jgi:hypothetical protein